MKKEFNVEFEVEDINDVLGESRDFVVPFAMTLEENNLYVEIYSDNLKYGEEFINQYYGRWFSKNALNELLGEFDLYLQDHGYKVDSYGAYRFYRNFRRSSGLNEDEADMIKANTCMYGEIDSEIPNITGLHFDDSDGLPKESFVTVEDGMIVSAATVNDYCPDSKIVEITVKTASKYRKKGYGVSNVLALSQYLTSCGKQVAYCCSKNNISSVKLAKRCGFIEIGKMYAVCGYLV